MKSKEEFSNSFEEVNSEIRKTKMEYDKKFGDFYHKILQNLESIKKLKSFAEDYKIFKVDSISKLD